MNLWQRYVQALRKSIQLEMLPPEAAAIRARKAFGAALIWFLSAGILLMYLPVFLYKVSNPAHAVDMMDLLTLFFGVVGPPFLIITKGNPALHQGILYRNQSRQRDKQ